MKVITVREVPDDLYLAIKRLAQQSRRSIQQQVLMLIERARLLDRTAAITTARSIRSRLSERQLGDTVAEVRSLRASS